MSNLPAKIEQNIPLQGQLPFIVYSFPLEVLLLDDDFITSKALDDLNDVRKPEWREKPYALNYRGTFVVNGAIGKSMQWASRDVETPNLWAYLQAKFNLKDGDYIQITNAIPTYIRLGGVMSVAASVTKAKEALLANG